MTLESSKPKFSSVLPATAVAIAASLLCSPFLNAQSNPGHMENEYTQVNLVSNGFVSAKVTDPNLVNPWGLTAGPTTPPWISNQVTNTATVDPVSVVETGGAPALTVTIPTMAGGPNGPTGIVYNLDSAGNGFGIPAASGISTVPSVFLFADLNGTILGWSPKSTGGAKEAVVAVDNNAVHAAYTGLSMVMVAPSTYYLYAANFTPQGGIEVFNSSWDTVTDLANNAFQDPELPMLPTTEVWAPYNITNLNGQMYVAYDAIPATGGLPITNMGLGVIAIFTIDGQFVRNVAVDGGRGDMDDYASARPGRLDAPWGMVMAPADFGPFSNDLLVGNFGNGQILAYHVTTNHGGDQGGNGRGHDRFAGTLLGTDHQPLENGFLWTLWFGNGVDDAETNTLYITTGGSNESTDGLFAAITPAP